MVERWQDYWERYLLCSVNTFPSEQFHLESFTLTPASGCQQGLAVVCFVKFCSNPFLSCQFRGFNSFTWRLFSCSIMCIWISKSSLSERNLTWMMRGYIPSRNRWICEDTQVRVNQRCEECTLKEYSFFLSFPLFLPTCIHNNLCSVNTSTIFLVLEE